MNTCLRVFLLLCLLGKTFSLFSQGKLKFTKWPNGITYEIYVQSFADSNGDGKGDINGLTSKIPYLKELGVDAVWLMPIHPSRSYHKYDVKDYYAIDPDYGTLDDFKRFVTEAHKKNIKVVIDLVINHSGRDHPWFREAVSNPKSPYWHYYVWAHKDDPQVITQSNITAGETRRRNRWQKIDTSEFLYYAQFGAHMPDLNFDNAQLRQEIFKIGKFWAEEVKVDGFRLDAARHIYPDERAAENFKWWDYFRQEMLKINKDFYLVGEVWAPTEEVAPYLKGIPALFNFDMAGEIIRSLQTGKGDSFAIRHKKIRDHYLSVNPDFIDAIFLSNHDQNRIMSMLNDKEEKARLAVSILMSMPGAPYLYYGEEIGMKGKKPDENIREPFLWDIKPRDNVRATWEQSKFSTDTSVTSAELQLKNEESIFNHYRKMINLRHRTKSLAKGDLLPVKLGEASVIAFTRTFEDETMLVLHNVSANNVQFSLPAAMKEYDRIFFKANGADFTGNVVMAPLSTIILKGRVPYKGW